LDALEGADAVPAGRGEADSRNPRSAKGTEKAIFLNTGFGRLMAEKHLQNGNLS
jgi:hypothetical protein